MERDFFICPIQINRKVVYTINYQNDFSGFHLTPDGSIAAFTSISKLDEYAAQMKITHLRCLETYNLDIAFDWLKSPKGKSIECSKFIDVWNLSGDYRNAVAQKNMDSEDKSHAELYQKLFWGCNLPAVTPAGKKFRPVWTKAEVRELKRVMRESLSIFEQHLSVQA